jgi:hypothetical protein
MEHFVNPSYDKLKRWMAKRGVSSTIQCGGNIKIDADKYVEWITDDERYITQNIVKIVDEGGKEFEEIMNKYAFTLIYPNKHNTNALRILLANGKFDIIKQILDADFMFAQSFSNDEPLIQSLLQYPQMYNYLLAFIPKCDNPYVFLTGNYIDGKTFTGKCVEKYTECNGKQHKHINECTVAMIRIIIETIQRIYELVDDYEGLYDAGIDLTYVIRGLHLTDILEYVLSSINYKQPVLIFPLHNGMTAIDYLIYGEQIEALYGFLDDVKEIKFVDKVANSLFDLIVAKRQGVFRDMPNDVVIHIILKIIAKSNVHNIYDRFGTNIVTVLLKNYELKSDLDIKAMSIALLNFNIFEQNIFGESVFSVATDMLGEKSKQLFSGKYACDSQVRLENPYKINISRIDYNFSPTKDGLFHLPKSVLVKTKRGEFSPELDMTLAYTYLICEKYKDSLQVPYDKNNEPVATEDADQLISSIAKLNELLNVEYSGFSPYCMLWSDNNFIMNTAILDLIRNSDKRFVFFRVFIVKHEFSHCNFIIVDKKQRTVEQYEPYGNFHYTFLTKEIVQKEIAEPLYYDYVFCGGAGFQARDDIQKEGNKVVGDPDGYCFAWCLFLLEMRLSMPDIKMCKLIQIINNYIINRFFDEFDVDNVEQNKYIVFVRYYGAYLKKGFEKLGIAKQSTSLVGMKKGKKDGELDRGELNELFAKLV